MTLFMETTRINSQRTVSEIQGILSEHGACQILLDFEGKDVSAVSFRYKVGENNVPFMLPCRWRELEALLRTSGKRPQRDDTFESWAKRVAWRQILRWVEAQMSLVETGMVKVQEVFLPYVQNSDGTTIYERMEKKQFMALGYEKEK